MQQPNSSDNGHRQPQADATEHASGDRSPSKANAQLDSSAGASNAAFATVGRFSFAQQRDEGDGFRRFVEPSQSRITTHSAILAARNGDAIGLLKLLQEHPFDAVGMDDATQETAFSVAFANGHRRICELLLEYGAAPVGACTSYNDGKLCWDSLVRLAVRQANLPLLRWLLDVGAAMYTPEIDRGCSALALAAWNGEVAIANELLARGATLEGHQCLDLPLWRGFRSEVRMIDEAATDLTSFRLLAIACWRQNDQLRKHLLATHRSLQDPELMWQYGALALYCATYREDEAAALELLTRGVGANSDCCGCASVYSAAVQVDSVKLLRLLMATSETPASWEELLLMAAKCGAVACVQELLLLTSEVEAPLRDQALERTVAIDSVDMARMLLRACPADITSCSLERCLRDATEHGNVELLELLLSHQDTIPSPYLQSCASLACLKGHSAVVSLLVAYGVDVNAPSLHGTSFLLHVVVSTVFRNPESVEIARILLEHGASVDATNTFDETPLVALNHKRSQAKTDQSVAQFEAMHNLLLNT